MKIRREIIFTKPAAATLPEKLARAVARQSSLYREVVAEKEEILRHKWFMSERAGRDVGITLATLDWITHHRTGWRKSWRRKNAALESD